MSDTIKRIKKKLLNLTRDDFRELLMETTDEEKRQQIWDMKKTLHDMRDELHEMK